MARVLRAGIIGSTGHGDYGHHIDTAYEGLSSVEVVAVADPDTAGRKAAATRTGATKLYADYREMLLAENLDLVNVCPRHVDGHAEMVIAAAEADVRGILCEKPMAPTLAQTDAMLDACQSAGTRMAVAHRRANAYERHGKQLVDDGLIGDVRIIRAHGKADHRSGGQDLMVLGTHMMDSIRYFARADPVWAFGHVTQDGRDITSADIRQGDEGIGLIAGNGVQSYYSFANGVTATFESVPGYPLSSLTATWLGFEVHGTEGVMSLRSSPSGELYLYPHGQWTPEHGDAWERVRIDEWDNNPDGSVRPDQERMLLSNTLIAEELVLAVNEDRDVSAVSNGHDGRAALEMIMAVHESQRLQTRVEFPLRNRDNPYETWLAEAGAVPQ
jgi:predicted dehydrogenase